MTLKITQAAREAVNAFLNVEGLSMTADDNPGLVQAFQRAMNQAADEALERAEARMNDFAREARKVAHDGPSRSPESCYEYAAKGIRALKGQQP